MSSADHDAITRLTALFEAAWCDQGRPLIADYVSQVEIVDRESLLGNLIAVDIRFRRSRSETLRAEDYLQLGPNAVFIAERELQATDANGNTCGHVE